MKKALALLMLSAGALLAREVQKPLKACFVLTAKGDGSIAGNDLRYSAYSKRARSLQSRYGSRFD